MCIFLYLQGTFAFSLIKYTPLKYNNEYVYPWWGYVIGWLLALSSMVCIPLWMVYKISSTQGTFREVTLVLTHIYSVIFSVTAIATTTTTHCVSLQRIQLLITPSDDLPKTKREQESLLAIFAPEEDATMNKNGYIPVAETDSNL